MAKAKSETHPKTDSRPKKPATPRLPADVKVAVAAALDKKALDVVALDLRKASAFTDFFVICTGTNLRQVKAIADGVEEALRAKGLKPALTEGYNRGDWVLIDYFDFIVHIFSPQTREFYGLERLWGDAKRIEIPSPSA
jgi:ribosome-associated protein